MTEGSAKKSALRAAHLGPEKRRPQVLDAALAIAIESGAARVSIDAIAKRMGVTRPVVYACFPSREALLDALLSREERKLLQGVLAALPSTPPIFKPERLVIHGFQALLRVVLENTGAWELVFSPVPDPSVSARFGVAREKVQARVALLMKPALVAAGVKDIQRKLPVLVELFMSVGDAAVRSQVKYGHQWTPDELGAFVGRLVFATLRTA